MRLSAATIKKARNAVLPAYDRAVVCPGVVHLGLGNFHRAHQAVYIDDCLADDPDWGIVGVSLRRPDMHDALAPQDGLYTVAERSAEGTQCRIIGSVLETLFAGTNTAALIARMADPAIRIISLTVTEKGYCHDPASGDLDTDHPAIVADRQNPDAPRSVPGLLAAALAKRQAAGAAPFTVLCCDNLPANGETVGRLVAQFAALDDDRLARWIETEICFPSTMVDRIVPATTDADRADIAALTGLEDAWPVMTEPFRQWVIEDRFGSGRPALERAGAELVSDVRPYELMKLRMLNGAHSALAYFGQLLGLETVADAFGDAGLRPFVEAMWRDEIAPTVPLAKDRVDAYARALAARFDNPALRHRTAQIAMDGSQKVPQRFLQTITARRAAGAPHGRLTRAVAAWIGYAANADGRFDVNDPMASRFAAIAAESNPATAARRIIAMDEIFGPLSRDTGFVAELETACAIIAEQGPRALLEA